MKRGFTLIEIAVVIGIFGIVATVLTNIILKTVMEGNRSLTQNEIRQNAERVMADIGAEIRKAGCVKYVVSGTSATLTTYNEKSCTNVGATFISNTNTLTKNGKNLIAGSVVPLSCSGSFRGCICSEAAGNGLNSTALPGGSTGAVSVTLSLQQPTTRTRTDFCGQVTLTDTFTPRN